ncbi:tripartite tricarboxylate transporter TctB family protein [Dongia sp.]|uniref:tripartite tricarboxylate transporter TctB family protein n=1 Tax=Dongia sp. TaxID=1977262 RepID=UPI0035B467FC
MSSDNQSSRAQRWQEGAIGLVLLVLGAGIIFGTFSVSALPGQDSLGPRLFPALIGGGLILLGLAHFRPAKMDDREGHADEGHWPSLLWMVAGLVIGALAYKPLGFIPAAWAVFFLTARGFAGKWDWRHGAIGLVVVLIAFFGFTKGLGLNLPTGILKSILGGH